MVESVQSRVLLYDCHFPRTLIGWFWRFYTGYDVIFASCGYRGE